MARQPNKIPDGLTPSDIEGKFWIKEGKNIRVKYTKLMLWLHSKGYRIYENEIVQINHSIIKIVEEKELKATFLKTVEDYMVDQFYEKVGKIFSDDGGVMAMLAKLEDKFIKDTENETWLFFQNYAVQIQPHAINTIPYKNLSGYVWESAIIPRDYFIEDFNGCDAERFVSILGGEKHEQLQQLLGYTMSRYKDATNPRAVILTEDIDPEQEGDAQGGSGKGLLFSFIRQFRKVTDFDGKNFKFDNQFLYQNVDIDTNVIFIDDVPNKFKFENLFSILTGSLQVNRKNKKQIIIPFEKSPKVFITSNYSIGARDGSSNRRKHDFAIVKHFGEDLEPEQEFGRQFFSGWSETEWRRFDNFMAHCCMSYLCSPSRKAINNITDNSKERSLIQNTNKDFVDYMDGQLECSFYDFAPQELKTFTGDIAGIWTVNGVDYQKWKQNMEQQRPNPSLFIILTNDGFFDKITTKLKLKFLTNHRLTRWLNEWAKDRNVVIDARYGMSKNDKKIISFSPQNKTGELPPTHEEEIPF